MFVCFSWLVVGVVAQLQLVIDHAPRVVAPYIYADRFVISRCHGGCVKSFAVRRLVTLWSRVIVCHSFRFVSVFVARAPFRLASCNWLAVSKFHMLQFGTINQTSSGNVVASSKLLRVTSVTTKATQKTENQP